MATGVHRWLALLVILAAGGALVWLIRGTPPTQAAQRPSMILVVIESLRADRLRAHGSARHTMPNVEGLAQEGLIFERAFSAAPWTLPSVTSILTGLPPSAHGVIRYEDVLPSRLVTLPERLQEAGYQTSFLGINSLFESQRNLEQGFETYFGTDEIPSEQLHQEILGVLARRDKARPLFMYLHYFEPHCRYEPPPQLSGLYLPPPAPLRTGMTLREQQFRDMHECFQLSTREGEPILDVDHYLAQYDAEIRSVDTWIGLLLERLKTEGLYDESLVVVTADHGEAFWEHNDFGHGRQLYPESVRVPLVIKPPGGSRPTRIEDAVSALDLAPTLLAAAGLGPMAEGFGLDLSPLWTGASAAALTGRAVFSETNYDGRHVRAIVQGGHLLLMRSGSPPVERFDLRADPQARRDVSAADPAGTQQLLRALGEHTQRAADVAQTLGAETAPIPEDTLQKLRALGYTF